MGRVWTNLLSQQLTKTWQGNPFFAYDECTCNLIDHTFFAQKKQRDTAIACLLLLCCCEVWAGAAGLKCLHLTWLFPAEERNEFRKEAYLQRTQCCVLHCVRFGLGWKPCGWWLWSRGAGSNGWRQGKCQPNEFAKDTLCCRGMPQLPCRQRGRGERRASSFILTKHTHQAQGAALEQCRNGAAWRSSLSEHFPPWYLTCRVVCARACCLPCPARRLERHMHMHFSASRLCPRHIYAPLPPPLLRSAQLTTSFLPPFLPSLTQQTGQSLEPLPFPTPAPPSPECAASCSSRAQRPSSPPSYVEQRNNRSPSGPNSTGYSRRRTRRIPFPKART